MRKALQFVPALGVALALSACSPASDDVPPADAAADSPKQEDPSGADYGAGIATAPIPAQFHGIWDVPGGSCDPASEQRVEIDARRILFYESVGNVIGTTGEGDRIAASLSMEGEGDAWATQYQLVLDGDRLSMEDVGLPEGGDAIVRVRCSD
ncbi:hypothetical protein [Erythrobacter sp.]|uniref:hypothetical protein n=1 Tax=Erythrobacter sp. TaxID=1042 RepID=UPI0025EF31A2|nr:hypothetical protein [Erythrobacter sp.]